MDLQQIADACSQRFLRYVTVRHPIERDVGHLSEHARQLVLQRQLVEELNQLGLEPSRSTNTDT